MSKLVTSLLVTASSLGDIRKKGAASTLQPAKTNIQKTLHVEEPQGPFLEDGWRQLPVTTTTVTCAGTEYHESAKEILYVIQICVTFQVYSQRSAGIESDTRHGYPRLLPLHAISDSSDDSY